MKSKCVLIAIVFLVAAATAQVPETDVPQKPKRPRAQVYVLEGLGALGGSVACGCLGVGVAGLLGSAVGGFNSDDEWAMWKLVMVGGPVLVVTAAVLPATTAYGTILAGKRLVENGSEGRAYGGAYAGAVIATGLTCLGAYVGSNTDKRAGIPFYVVGGLAIPVGAVIGYNTGIKREALGQGFEGRLQLPAVALTSTRLPDRSVEHGVKVQLAGLKF